MKRRTARRPGEPGAALLLAVVFTFVLIGVGAVLVDYVVQGFRLTHTDYDGVRATPRPMPASTWRSMC